MRTVKKPARKLCSLRLAMGTPLFHLRYRFNSGPLLYTYIRWRILWELVIRAWYSHPLPDLAFGWLSPGVSRWRCYLGLVWHAETKARTWACSCRRVSGDTVIGVGSRDRSRGTTRLYAVLTSKKNVNFDHLKCWIFQVLMIIWQIAIFFTVIFQNKIFYLTNLNYLFLNAQLNSNFWLFEFWNFEFSNLNFWIFECRIIGCSMSCFNSFNYPH